MLVPALCTKTKSNLRNPSTQRKREWHWGEVTGEAAWEIPGPAQADTYASSASYCDFPSLLKMYLISSQELVHPDMKVKSNQKQNFCGCFQLTRQHCRDAIWTYINTSRLEGHTRTNSKWGMLMAQDEEIREIRENPEMRKEEWICLSREQKDTAYSLLPVFLH